MHTTPSHGKTLTPLRRNVRFGILDGVTAMPLVMLSQPGNFVMAALLTTSFGFTTRTYGLFTSLPFWFNFLQVLLTPALAQHLHSRSMTILSAWLHVVGWISLLVALPFLPAEESPRTVFVFFATFSLVSLSSAINGVAWNAWMQECIPVRLRGKYFGFRNRLLYLSQVSFMLGVSALLAWLDGSLLAYQLLFGGALVLRVCSVLSQQQMHTTSGPNVSAPEPPWRDQLRIIRKDPTLIHFILFASALGFTANVVGPFYPVFMYEQLHLSAAHTNLLILLGVLGAAIAFPAWGRLLDRFGNIPVMIVSIILWQAALLAMSIATDRNKWIIYVVMGASGLFSAGYGIGVFGLLLKLTPSGARTMGMALFVSISSLTAALGPVTGGFFLNYAKSHGISLLHAYHVMFMVCPIFVTATCLLLRRVREENSAPVTEVMGAMRSVRTVASLFGLTFLVNQVFFRIGEGRFSTRLRRTLR
ncbi:MAG TPA: MFS transporter [Opitutaceae bacterium]|nr:MFS transporter [Opitutaceae bacterium]HND61168.1 MFS transporter [Opitutaceae bacterium]